MTDLTKITTPLGLLDEETQEALRAHGGPYETWNSQGGWRDWTEYGSPEFDYTNLVYRVKPAPPKPREWWLSIGNTGRIYAHAEPVRDDGDHEIIHVREVLP